MKKRIQDKKKLSLNKVQVMKITDLKTIKGGGKNNPMIIFNGIDDSTDPTIHNTLGQQ